MHFMFFVNDMYQNDKYYVKGILSFNRKDVRNINGSMKLFSISDLS